MDAREAENNGYDPEPIKGINTRFEEYMKNEFGKNIRVQYETFSTNEDMINQLRTGKIDFDLVCPSDYAIQRLMAQDLIIPFESNDYPGSTPNYDHYASPYLIEKVKSIKAVDCYNGGTSGEEKLTSCKIICVDICGVLSVFSIILLSINSKIEISHRKNHQRYSRLEHNVGRRL